MQKSEEAEQRRSSSGEAAVGGMTGSSGSCSTATSTATAASDELPSGADGSCEASVKNAAEENRRRSVGLRKPIWGEVSSLDPNAHGVNLIVKVVSTKPRAEGRRSKGNTAAIAPAGGGGGGGGVEAAAEAVVGDSTGVVTLTLTKEQVHICEIGRTVCIRNGVVRMSRQHMRLEVNKWGKLEAADTDATFVVNTKNDMSGIEYELVAVTD